MLVLKQFFTTVITVVNLIVFKISTYLLAMKVKIIKKTSDSLGKLLNVVNVCLFKLTLNTFHRN